MLLGYVLFLLMCLDNISVYKISNKVENLLHDLITLVILRKILRSYNDL